MSICCKGIILALLIHASFWAIGQQNRYYHPSALGANFSLFQFHQTSKNTSLVPGIGVYYISSINRYLDWNINLDGTFTNNIEKTVLADKKLLLKSNAVLRVRGIPKANWVQPFLSTGIEGLNYDRKGYLFLPVNAGLEFNYKNIFVLLNVGYHQSLSQNLYSYYQYGVGISGTVGLKKKKPGPKKSLAFKNIAVDTDGDGIIDSQDSCREVPGMLKFHGCPDTDGDGIEDKKDKCPLIFGVAKYNGCPVPDSDKDGINDEEDSCINQPGLSRYHGCPIPDTDGDGVNDEEDSCVHVQGPKSNNGCPVIKKEFTEEMQKAAKNILFKTGSYQLLPSSYKSLNKVASILKENPDLNLIIEGHTDNQGTEGLNQILSENRANAVLNYIKAEGISEVRLKAFGYGQTKPIDTNSTSKGRANNRRVELKLYY